MQRLALLFRAPVAHIAAVLHEPLAAERLAHGGNPRHEAAAGPETIPQNDLSAEDDEDSVGRGSTLVHRESTRPGCSRPKGGECISVVARESRDPRYGYGCHVTTCRRLRLR